MSTAELTRSVEFSAAHRYYRPDWTDEKNRQVFGACANESGHGHTYRCSVTVRGAVSEETSMVLDLAVFDEILRDEVLTPFDHQHMNHAIPAFAYGKTIPTAEAVAGYVWVRIEKRLPPTVTLRRVRIREDRTLHADYFGPSDD